MNIGWNYRREHLRLDQRSHYVIVNGGNQPNVVPSEAAVWYYFRERDYENIKQLHDLGTTIAKAAAMAAKAPEPEVKVSADHFTPALINDVPLARRTAALFREVLGPEKVREVPPILGGEDFSRYAGPDKKIPIFMYFLGTMPPERIAEAAKGGPSLPSMHSDQYYPVPEPSIRTGVLTMTLAVLNQMGR